MGRRKTPSGVVPMIKQHYEMQLRSGRKFYPGEMQANIVDIRDIASALSKICRFGGHNLRFFSVAEHSIVVSKLVQAKTGNNRLALQGLLHDAHEAYIGDFPSPLKRYFPELETISDQAWEAVRRHFNLPVKLDPVVKEADREAMTLEVRQNMAKPIDVDWSGLAEPTKVFALEFLDPKKAELRFLRRYRKLA